MWGRRPSIFDMFSDLWGESPFEREGMEDDWFREPFEDLIRRLQEGELSEEGCEAPTTEGGAEEGATRRYGPFVYGFSYSAEPGKEPRFQEFGNVKPSRRGLEPSSGREPLVDIMDEDDKYKIYIEMPGADKENIKLDAAENRINISTTDKKFSKTVDLDSPINPDSAKASYKNGVLTVEAEKESKRYGKEVKVE
jgi:HSP20 family protein